MALNSSLEDKNGKHEAIDLTKTANDFTEKQKGVKRSFILGVYFDSNKWCQCPVFESESYSKVAFPCFSHINFPAKSSLVTWLVLPNEINNINPEVAQPHKYFSSTAILNTTIACFYRILFQVICFHWLMVCVTRNLCSQLLLRLNVWYRITLFLATCLWLFQASASKRPTAKIFCL